MKKEQINKKIIDAVINAQELKWIRYIGKQPYMFLEDVEKMIYGIFNESYIENLIRLNHNQER